MLDPARFTLELENNGFGFFTGVPDSLLKEFCACISSTVPADRHVIAANEGGAVALAAGYHLATGKAGVVYLQNSGVGNTVNPLLSLADPDVYAIPMLIIVGWRGEPGTKDEPQHFKQGRIHQRLIEAFEYPHEVLSPEPGVALEQLQRLTQKMYAGNTPVVLTVRKNTFAPFYGEKRSSVYTMTREQALEVLLTHLKDTDRLVSTTGKTSRELFELREHLGQDHSRDFLTVGSMGHASMIALGLARGSDRTVYCIDGDGAALMHFGAFPIIARHAPGNFRHVLINNGSHESVGGQPTVGYELGFALIARQAGYRATCSAQTAEELTQAVVTTTAEPGPTLIEVRVKPGSRADLQRPTTTAVENKRGFMETFLAQKHA